MRYYCQTCCKNIYLRPQDVAGEVVCCVFCHSTIGDIMTEIITHYKDAIDSLAQSAESIHDLTPDDRRHISYQYLKDATTDELHRIFTSEFGIGWVNLLARFLTEDIGSEEHDRWLESVFRAIAEIVEYDLAKARKEALIDSGPNEDQLNRILDARERLSAIPASLQRQAD